MERLVIQYTTVLVRNTCVGRVHRRFIFFLVIKEALESSFTLSVLRAEGGLSTMINRPVQASNAYSYHPGSPCVVILFPDLRPAPVMPGLFSRASGSAVPTLVDLLALNCDTVFDLCLECSY